MAGAPQDIMRTMTIMVISTTMSVMIAMITMSVMIARIATVIMTMAVIMRIMVIMVVMIVIIVRRITYVIRMIMVIMVITTITMIILIWIAKIVVVAMTSMAIMTITSPMVAMIAMIVMTAMAAMIANMAMISMAITADMTLMITMIITAILVIMVIVVIVVIVITMVIIITVITIVIHAWRSSIHVGLCSIIVVTRIALLGDGQKAAFRNYRDNRMASVENQVSLWVRAEVLYKALCKAKDLVPEMTHHNPGDTTPKSARKRHAMLMHVLDDAITAEREEAKQEKAEKGFVDQFTRGARRDPLNQLPRYSRASGSGKAAKRKPNGKCSQCRRRVCLAAVAADDNACVLGLDLDLAGDESVEGAAVDWSRCSHWVPPAVLREVAVRAGLPECMWRPMLDAYAFLRFARGADSPWRVAPPTQELAPGCPAATLACVGDAELVASGGGTGAGRGTPRLRRRFAGAWWHFGRDLRALGH